MKKITDGKKYDTEPDASEIAMVMSALGRRRSAAKAAASRANGRKGGRPRKERGDKETQQSGKGAKK